MGKLTLPGGDRLSAQAQASVTRRHAIKDMALEVVTNFGVRFILEVGGRSFGAVQPSQIPMILLTTPCCGAQYLADGWEQTLCPKCDSSFPLGIHYTEFRYLSLYPVERMFEGQAALVIDPLAARLASEALGLQLDAYRELLASVHGEAGVVSLELP